MTRNELTALLAELAREAAQYPAGSPAQRVIIARAVAAWAAAQPPRPVAPARVPAPPPHTDRAVVKPVIAPPPPPRRPPPPPPPSAPSRPPRIVAPAPQPPVRSIEGPFFAQRVVLNAVIRPRPLRK